ncbi:polysaccharide pyruvyl transferase family protein [Paracoccus luteus]|uniref:polysaccharide pyruvyl transferase family protein n=1 Tax=Paracoccus luteus TaxID=2508543 RepID=UPI00106F4E5B|nr:polysaccharide pyruvyl transferase family protein [Paracoccus luteus]
MTPSDPPARKALVTGHFSTVGDLEVLGHVLDRLRDKRVEHVVSPYTQDLVGLDPGWVDAATLDPAGFTHLIVVCGPYAPNYPVRHPVIFDRFRHCVHIGINLTMVAPLDECNPFDALLERDSDRIVRPDLSFLRSVPRIPVVGLCLVRSQREYGDRQLHKQAEVRLRALLLRAGVAVVEMDTTVPRQANRNGIGTEAEFESICARLDAVVTNRLHGTVLALKNGVPALAVDAIAGGDKVTRQAELLRWPEVLALDSATDDDLDAALARCLAPDARGRAMACAARARDLLAGHDASFAVALEAEARPDRRPPVTGQRHRLSQMAARYRHWKRGRFPRRG